MKKIKFGFKKLTIFFNINYLLFFYFIFNGLYFKLYKILENKQSFKNINKSLVKTAIVTKILILITRIVIQK